MKRSLNKLALNLVMALALMLTLNACGDSNNGSVTKNIVENAQANEDLQTLVAAIEAADLVDALSGDGPFTVFAPTDEAFALLGDAVNVLLQPENKDALTNILTYHVYAGEVLEENAVALDGETVDMLNGLGMNIDVVDGAVILNLGGDREAVVTTTDILASNGVIHVIDAVLNPADGPDIVDRAMANEDLETLVAAVVAADLVDALSGAGPLTVFAPTDAAFDLLGDAVTDLLLPANIDALTNLLTYHVYAGKVLAEDAVALDGETVDMLNGLGMSIDVVDGAVILNLGGDREAVVTTTDILASNGVIHVIDAVLTPTDAPDIVDRAMANEDLETLVAAVVAADLVDALSGPGPLTVFAPTDDAFALLGDAVNVLLQPENKDALTNLLTYHVYAGKVLAEDAVALAPATVTMLNALGMSIDVVDGDVILNLGGVREAVVTSTDILASNGVIHIIDAVLNPADAP